ncbi:MAG: hypothetical protein V6003_01450 [Candidatus Dasytiphilus stammeri]
MYVNCLYWTWSNIIRFGFNSSKFGKKINFAKIGLLNVHLLCRRFALHFSKLHPGM